MATCTRVKEVVNWTAEQTQKNRSFRRNFIVTFDEPVEDWSIIFTAEDPTTGDMVPKAGDEHPYDEYATVKKIKWNCEKQKGNAYVVNVDYDTESNYAGWSRDRESELGFCDDPLLRPSVEEWSHERYPTVLTQAYAKWNFEDEEWDTGSTAYVNGRKVKLGVPIENAAGQEFDPPVMGESVVTIRVLTRNQEEWDYTETESYINTVNSVDWYKFKAGQVLMHDITANKIYESGRWYYRVRYEQHIKEHWYKVVPNLGLGYLDSGGNIKVCRDGEDYTYTQPVKLKADGTLAEAGASTNYLVFRVFPEKDFTPLLS